MTYPMFSASEPAYDWKAMARCRKKGRKRVRRKKGRKRVRRKKEKM
jgi:hypothetical protein